MRNRRVSRIYSTFIDKDDVTQTTTGGIVYTFVEFLKSKYEPLHVGDACVIRTENTGHRTLPLRWKDFLDTPITEEELRAAESKGACNKLREEMAFAWNFLNSNGCA